MTPGGPELRVTFGHGARHLIDTELSAAEVEAAIAAALRAQAIAERTDVRGTVEIGGITIEYRAFRRADVVHVGTYFPT